MTWRGGRQPRTSGYVCPPDHPHGAKRTCYVTHKCACQPCRDAAAQRSALMRRNRAYGRPTTTMRDAAPVHEYVRMLTEHGIGRRRIAELAGCRYSTARYLADGESTRITADLADRILAIRPDTGLAPGAFISAVGAKRRIRALGRIGYTRTAIAGELGMFHQQVSRYLTQDFITVRLHRQIAEVYDRLCMTPAPDSRASRYAIRIARENKDPGPLDWDDIDFDSSPRRVREGSRLNFVDELVVELACNGQRPRRLSHAETRLVIRELHSRQFGDPLIAERAGISDREVVRIRKHELGLPAVAYGVSVHRRVA